MSKPTPGPWGLKINRYSHVNGVDLTFAVCARGFTLTSGQSMEHLLDVAPAPILAAECEANARLIAAAPELLEALRGCVEHMEWSNFHGREARDAAVAAIAQATGAES